MSDPASAPSGANPASASTGRRRPRAWTVVGSLVLAAAAAVAVLAVLAVASLLRGLR